jgi:DNA-binding transcriptional MocR family regulator
MIEGENNRTASGTRVGTVMDSLRERIASRSLMPGARVPSIRAMTETLGVSKSTVVEAYDRLVAEGVIVARRSSGFFVSGHAPPLALADLGPRLDREVDPLWLTRQSLEAGSKVLKPGCGWVPAAWLPEDGVRRALRSPCSPTTRARPVCPRCASSWHGGSRSTAWMRRPSRSC